MIRFRLETLIKLYEGPNVKKCSFVLAINTNLLENEKNNLINCNRSSGIGHYIV